MFRLFLWPAFAVSWKIHGFERMKLGHSNGQHRKTFARAVAAAAMAALCALPALAQSVQARKLRLAVETFERGQELESQGKLDEAIVEYRRALRQDGEEAYWRAALATALEAKGEPAGALEELRRAAELSPDDCGLKRRFRELAQQLGAPEPAPDGACTPPPGAQQAANPDLDFERPVLRDRVAPQPVDKAWFARHGGTVVLRIFVDASGAVVAPEVVRPLGLGLDQEALRAVRQWKFQPARKNGAPVPCSVVVEITFAQFAGG